MKIFYYTLTGEIIQAVKSQDIFWQEDSIQFAYDILEIDELSPENKNLCIDIVKTQGKVNSEGLHKYYIVAGDLYERDSWEEYNELD